MSRTIVWFEQKRVRSIMGIAEGEIPCPKYCLRSVLTLFPSNSVTLKADLRGSATTDKNGEGNFSATLYNGYAAVTESSLECQKKPSG